MALRSCNNELKHHWLHIGPTWCFFTEAISLLTLSVKLILVSVPDIAWAISLTHSCQAYNNVWASCPTILRRPADKL